MACCYSSASTTSIRRFRAQEILSAALLKNPRSIWPPEPASSHSTIPMAIMSWSARSTEGQPACPGQPLSIGSAGLAVIFTSAQ